MAEFSVIIPVYNVESYLKECLESLVCQTYSSFEAILVDDGSTDRSGMICDTYRKKDSRFKVIHKCNGGVSDARNYGIKAATGKWIIFLDADDALFSTALERLHQEILIDSCDAYFFAAETFSDHGFEDRILYYPNLSSLGVMSGKSFMHYAVKTCNWLPKSVWCAAISKLSLEKAAVEFDVKYVAAEDAKFLYEYLSECGKVRYIPIVLYRYRIFRKFSAMSTMGIRHIMGRFRYSVNCYREAIKHDDVLLATFFSRAAADAISDLYMVCKEEYENVKYEIKCNMDVVSSATGIKYRVANMVWRVLGPKNGSAVLHVISKYILMGKYGR